MTQRTFDRDVLTARLEGLDPRQRSRFAIACAERLLPSYRRFQELTGRGSPDVIAEALGAARAHLASGGEADSELVQFVESCQALVPTEDDPWTAESGIAQNAAAAAVYAVRSVISGSVDDAVWAAVQGYEAADLIASGELDADFNTPGIEERIAERDVVQRELTVQDELLSQLERGERE
jgi:uncharacterized protein YjaG (DUF416 family)